MKCDQNIEHLKSNIFSTGQVSSKDSGKIFIGSKNSLKLFITWLKVVNIVIYIFTIFQSFQGSKRYLRLITMKSVSNHTEFIVWASTDLNTIKIDFTEKIKSVWKLEMPNNPPQPFSKIPQFQIRFENSLQNKVDIKLHFWKCHQLYHFSIQAVMTLKL